jgi:hypothetical protein
MSIMKNKKIVEKLSYIKFANWLEFNLMRPDNISHIKTKELDSFL